MCANPFIPPPPSTRAMRRLSNDRLLLSSDWYCRLRTKYSRSQAKDRAPTCEDRRGTLAVTSVAVKPRKSRATFVARLFTTIPTCPPSRQEQIQSVKTDGRAAEH